MLILTAAPVICAQVVGVAVQGEGCIGDAICHTAHDDSKVLCIIGLRYSRRS